RILVDYARSHLYAKRGGGVRELQLDAVPEPVAERAAELVALDDALTDLANLDPDQSKIVELRYFCGFTSEEIAELLGLSIPTVTRRWRMARAWLYRHLAGEEHHEV
ncbi:MAG: sigma-70 family RNA polymerase sigma factor, partial [bacterium]|nr:sigma-70 family RNA polymerase sigma factor [bacterium]